MFARLTNVAKQALAKRIFTSLLFIGLPIVAFVGLANEVKETNPVVGDIAILHGLHSIASPALDTLFLVITNLGGAPVVSIVVIGILTFLLRRKQYRDALFVASTVGGTVLLNTLFKLLFQRTRPSLWQQIITEKGYSFPSGHAMMSCSLALTIMILCWPTRWRRLAIIVGSAYFVLVSISRLYLGVHYPSDVIGGWLVSIAWLYLVHRSFGIFSPRNPVMPATESTEGSEVAPAHK